MSINYAAVAFLPEVSEPAPAPRFETNLADAPLKQLVEVVHMEVQGEDISPLLERGIVPGSHVLPVRRSPSGDPIVRVDGGLVSLRVEIARSLGVRFIQPGS